jgi:hypothetical protein
MSLWGKAGKQYRASNNVVLGKPDEHAYNMFLSVMQMFYRLNLWHTCIPEQKLFWAYQRLVNPMKVDRIKRKQDVEKTVHGSSHRY